jgi:hypothetical protein
MSLARSFFSGSAVGSIPSRFQASQQLRRHVALRCDPARGPLDGQAALRRATLEQLSGDRAFDGSELTDEQDPRGQVGRGNRGAGGKGDCGSRKERRLSVGDMPSR